LLSYDEDSIIELISEAELYQYAKDISYDLFIFDSNNQDSLNRFSQGVRATSKNRDTPILFASTCKINFKKVFDGFDNAPILSTLKPFSPKDIINKINLLLNIKSQKDELIRKNIELGHALNEIRESKELIDQQKSQIISQIRLASLGEMAGGIAHEINNPLAVISCSINILKKLINKNRLHDEMATENIYRIETTIDRITKIIKGLKTVSRESDGSDFNKVTFKEVFEDILGLCSERFKNHGILLDIDIESDEFLMEFNCDRVQFSQVLINLIGNAYDAVESLQIKWVKIELRHSADHYHLSIIDSGPGIDEEIAKKMFNPFFTSKRIGKGTGLGLSISRSIIEKHGGDLNIDQSSPNTCFTINIPQEFEPELKDENNPDSTNEKTIKKAS
jgi:C4-dicarboxylate-specific signal transduction histidine kinase